MKYTYNLTAIEILEQLGYKKSIPKYNMIMDSQQKNSALPSMLVEFLSLAADSSLFSTADIWVNHKPYFSFFYDDMEQRIAEEKEHWKNCSDGTIKNEYFQFYKLPKEHWGNIVSDYLCIGSDFAAGVVKFGICVADLEKSDPPVYMNHECDSISEWKLWTNSLSDFLMQVLCDALLCEMYETAVDVLEKNGWVSETIFEENLEAYKIERNAIKKYKSLYTDNVCGCVYAEEERTIFVIKLEERDEGIFSGIKYCKEEIPQQL